jgi:hypothetical protein
LLLERSVPDGHYWLLPVVFVKERILIRGLCCRCRVVFSQERAEPFEPAVETLPVVLEKSALSPVAVLDNAAGVALIKRSGTTWPYYRIPVVRKQCPSSRRRIETAGGSDP